jgi:hypothetical protein
MACSCCKGKTSPALGKISTRAMSSASFLATAASPAAAPVPLCSPAPGCPACGQLECLCRPRWVAGMVVSEADLNRLDYYITAKQRLHNRQLFGSGVACGLVVTCHPCGDGVVSVSPGYALGPCGEDIVVCAPDAVDVCAMIRQCRGLEQQAVNCRPWGDTAGCKDVQETWVLAIRYIEQPSRNAPMLRAGTGASCDCGSGCSCGSSCSGDCTTSTTGRTATPTACAPTVVCETYRYEVFRAPAQPDCSGDQKPPVGRLMQAMTTCAGDLIALLQNPPQVPLSQLTPDGEQQWVRYCSQIRAALYSHFTRFGTTRCGELTQLCQITCPTAGSPNFSTAMQQVLPALGPLIFAAVQDCICLALLPPCPDPQKDPRVPLAVITVSGAQNCSVVEICNWTPLRKIVGTAPNVSYWLSVFGLVETLRNGLFCACCGSQPAPWGAVYRAETAPLGAANTTAASSLGFGLSDLGLLGKWLGANQADPRELLTALKVAPDPAQVEALNQRVATLEATVAKLHATPNP